MRRLDARRRRRRRTVRCGSLPFTSRRELCSYRAILDVPIACDVYRVTTDVDWLQPVEAVVDDRCGMPTNVINLLHSQEDDVAQLRRELSSARLERDAYKRALERLGHTLDESLLPDIPDDDFTHDGFDDDDLTWPEF